MSVYDNNNNNHCNCDWVFVFEDQTRNFTIELLNYKSDVFDEYNCNDELNGINFSDPQRPLIDLIIVLLHPKSVGSIKLQSDDIKDAPLIDPNFLENSYDMEALYQAYTKLSDLLLLDPDDNNNSKFKQEYFEGRNEIKKDIGTCKQSF